MDPSGNQRDYYQVLSVSREATLLEIETALERKQQEYDPEKLEGLGERLLQLAQRETDLIRTAYEVLKDSQKRQRYDRQLDYQTKRSNRSSQENSVSNQAMRQRAEVANDRAIEVSEGGKHDEAIELWNKAIQKGLHLAELYNNLGSAYHYCGEPKLAIECLHNAIEIEPDLMEAYSKLAETYQSLGDTETAIENWYQVLRIDPACTDAIERLRQMNAAQYDLDNISEYQENQSLEMNARGKGRTLMQKIADTFKNLTT